MPWKPLPSEEETIRAQIEAAERTVSDAEIAFRQLRERDEEELRAASGEGAEVGEAAVAEQQDISTQSPPRDDVAEVADNGDEVDQQKPSHADEQADGADGNRVAEDGSGERRNSDIGDVTDIMEEGEDTVIY